MGNHSSNLTRRAFCWSAAAFPLSIPAPSATGAETPPWAQPAQVRQVYVAVDRPSWPHPKIDLAQSHAEVQGRLQELERKHPGAIRFTGGEIVKNKEEAAAWLNRSGDADAILIVPLTSRTDGLAYQLGETDLPALLFSRPYTGFQYSAFSEHIQKGRKADILATSEYGDLDVYARIFYVIGHVRRSKVLVADHGSYYHSFAPQFRDQFGVTLEPVEYRELTKAAEAVAPAAARKATDAYIGGALRVIEPSREEIFDSVRLYLGIKEVLRRRQANGIAIECLGGFQKGLLKAYPCVAFSKLNDEGLYGVCQGDLQCAVTQLALTALSGKPGFVANPVFDSSRNEIIYAHCVAPTSPLGLGAQPSPYLLRSHMEDDKGVSVQVFMPVGGTVTAGKFVTAREFRYAVGEAMGNVDVPTGCRTQVRVRVADAARVARRFSDRGVHRVLYYGDYSEPLEKMGRLRGFRVEREDAGTVS
jgi:L-fucose isomerase-like protein